ncbi:AMP-binding protein [Leisingera thetidis]|uniref:AMP-binding protein n=1 Tax=Leisingera thetidis TaxID=2930199 RepID=UPI0021F7EE0B|nr:AMP-binding protein [Leisingera thetidis]
MGIQSTMQHGNLGVAQLLRQALKYGCNAELTYESEGGRHRTTVRDTAVRAARLGAGLAARGVGPGAVVATLCNAEVEHFEAYLGVPARGMVLHPLNVRMHDGDLAEDVREIGDSVLIVSRGYLERYEQLAPMLAGSQVRLVLITGKGPVAPAKGLPVETMSYEEFLADVPMPAADALTDPEETSAATICQTGGTTGRPKTVVYSHRSVWLQALSLTSANSLGLSRRDTLLPAVPFFHVNGWGLPYAAVMAGTSLVLPGSDFSAAALDTLIEDYGVTIAAGVPTIWTDLLRLRDTSGAARFRSLSRLATGGAIIPDSLVAGMTERQIEIIQAWGMTETSSMSVLGRVRRHTADTGAKSQPPVGYPMPGLELRVVTADGAAVEPGNGQAGEIQIRGACVARCYHGIEAAEAFDGEWLKTGDIGTIDRLGRLTLTDRLKDAIKSGGEWIAAPVLENALRNLTGILDAAVIAMPDERFQERPLAVVVCKSGASPDIAACRKGLRELVPSWWVPDCWAVVPSIPLTGLGKPDKAVLRRLHETGALNIQRASSETLPTQINEQPETTHEN